MVSLLVVSYLFSTKFKDTVQQLPLKLKGYEVGTVDIDTESALNSRFLIQKLPSVYIIEEGVAKEILPNFNVDEFVDAIKSSDSRSPMFIQPFGVIGYLLFYLGFCGKYLMTIVKYLQVYLPTWVIIGLGALVFTITFFSLVLVTRPKAVKIDDTKKKQ